MRILVAIANYGFKHTEYLKRLIREYKSMPCDTDIIILSNVPKELEGNVVGVGFLVDRSSGRANFGVKQIPLMKLDIVTYKQEDCPLCKKGIELVKPGSKKLK